MKRAASILLALVLVLVLGIWLIRRADHPGQIDGRSEVTSASPLQDGIKTTEVTEAGGGTSSVFLGETILRDYANTNLPPQNDLTLMSRLMDNSLLLLKSAANRPLSANEDWADLFRGRNGAHERFLPNDSIALNTQGQLVDRWQTPLFFHALGNGRYEIRSAGPDQKLWTDDDIHRNADGSFRRGKALEAPSLLEEAIRERSPSTAP